MTKMLSSEERTLLLKTHKKERDKRVADRIKVILLVDDGWSFNQIAKALFLDESTVRDHFTIYQQENRVTPNHKGSETTLTSEESKDLSDHLVSKIYVRIKDIQAYVKATFQKEMAVSTLYDWLKSNGFSYKKPKIIPKNADPVKQEAFKALYHKIMNDAAIEGDIVLFGDSVHPSQQVRASYGWIKRRQDQCIESTSARKRMNLMGILNLETMQFAYQDFETINGEAAIEFLKKAEGEYPKARKVHLIWDQAGYHTCKEVKEFLKTSRIKVHYLPPRSPNLNPIERLWKIMHEYVSNNKVYEKFKDFKKSLFDFFDHTMPNIRTELFSRITDNFQTIPGK